MHGMTAPIVIDYHGDIAVCASLEIAEQYLEPDDVGSVDVYDADGHLLEAAAYGGWRLRTRISDLPGSPSDAARLRSVLVDDLSKMDKEPLASLDAPLDVLLVRAARLAGR